MTVPPLSLSSPTKNNKEHITTSRRRLLHVYIRATRRTQDTTSHALLSLSLPPLPSLILSGNQPYNLFSLSLSLSLSSLAAPTHVGQRRCLLLLWHSLAGCSRGAAPSLYSLVAAALSREGIGHQTHHRGEDHQQGARDARVYIHTRQNPSLARAYIRTPPRRRRPRVRERERAARSLARVCVCIKKCSAVRGARDASSSRAAPP